MLWRYYYCLLCAIEYYGNTPELGISEPVITHSHSSYPPLQCYWEKKHCVCQMHPLEMLSLACNNAFLLTAAAAAAAAACYTAGKVFLLALT